MQQPDYNVIATSRDGRDITKGFIHPELLQPPQDTVLQQRSAGDYALYREVLRDDQVQSCLQQRRDAMISREFVVDAGGNKRIDKKAADFIREMLTQIGFDHVSGKMHYGVYYGFAVGENIYVRDGQYVALDAIKVRDRRRFGFDGEQRLRLLTFEHPNGLLLPERKFWTFSTGADHDDEPYGLGLAHWLYWPVHFKKNGLTAWLKFLDKFATPSVLGKYPDDNTVSAEKRQQLLQACEDIQRDSAAVIPNSMTLDLLEVARNGAIDYATLFNSMQGIISKVILSQTMTTDNGSSRSQAEVHENVAKRVIKSDADLSCGSFNQQVVRWLCDWNFPEAAYPQVWRVMEDEEDVNQRAARETEIVGWGFKPTYKHVVDTYGGEWEQVEPPEPSTEENADKEAMAAESEAVTDEKKPLTTETTDYAEPHDDAISLAATKAASEWQDMMTPVMQPFLDLLQQVDDVPSFRQQLTTASVQMDMSVVTDHLTRLLFYHALSAQVADFAEIEPKEAITYFRQKGLAESFDYQSLHQSAHATSFTAAGIMQADVLDDMREFIDEAIEKGITRAQFEAQLIPRMQEKGWWGKKTITDPATGKTREIDINPQRIKRMFETNMRVTNAEAQWVRIQAQKKAFPFLLYDGLNSVESRKEHADWNGIILPVDDPFWEQVRPIKAWGCKCRLRALTKSQAARQGYHGEPAPKLKMVKHTHPRTGEQQLVPEGVDPEFYYPNGSWLSNLKRLLAERDRPDLPISKALQQVVDQPPLALQLAGIENTIKSASVEYAYVLRADGTLLQRSVGMADRVAIDMAELESDDIAQAIVTHNHPNSLSFSVPDIETAINLNLREIRVVCPDGKVYSMTRPVDGWMSVQTLRARYSRIKMQVQLENKRLGAEAITIDTTHRVWLQLAENFDIPYRVIPL